MAIYSLVKLVLKKMANFEPKLQRGDPLQNWLKIGHFLEYQLYKGCNYSLPILVGFHSLDCGMDGC